LSGAAAIRGARIADKRRDKSQESDGVFTRREMSSLRERAREQTSQLLIVVGSRIREERLRRRWTLRDLAGNAGVSAPAVHAVENGRGSFELVVALASALGLSVELALVDRKRRDRLAQANRAEDSVHAAMGELESGHLRQLLLPIGTDVPYQHYQFSGRADVVAWSVEDRALLHLENRTQFPNIQECVGSFGAKRAYFAEEFARRLDLRPFVSQTHVMVCLWSAEVLHTLRVRAETFRSTCPDSADRFESWWGGTPPPRGNTASLIVLDPLAEGRQRLWIDLATALDGARPRVLGYADAARRLQQRQQAA
jgi:transcriptional regulator with XRE-family HTH domain